MIIEGNGITLDVSRRGRSITYTVVDQSQEATEILNNLGHVTDNETGFTLKSNQRPSFNGNKKRFYIRGTDEEYDDKSVKASFLSEDEAINAMEALRRLINKVRQPNITRAGHTSCGKPRPGGTSHVRFAFINREMAKHLELTGKDHYPDPSPIQWTTTEPIVTINKHYNEHISQVVDVLNKSLEKPETVEGIINPHKVTPEQAKKAVSMLRKCFKEAYEDDFLIAWWRTVTGLRGPDFTEN